MDNVECVEMPHSRRERHAQLEIWNPLETSANTKYIMQKSKYHSESIINFSVASNNNPRWTIFTATHYTLQSHLFHMKKDKTERKLLALR